jgi:cytochrome c oxidase assembly factor CtaG
VTATLILVATSCAAAWGYLLAARSVRWPTARGAAFVAGLVALATSVSAPVDVAADHSAEAHMAQHLAIALLAAPLLVAGAPLTLALRALRGGSRQVLAAVLRSAVARTFVHPLVGVALFSAAMIGTHATALYSSALTDDSLHALEHLALLAGAIALWQPLLGAEPRAHRIAALGRIAVLLAAMPSMAVVGAWLISTDSVRYPHYIAELGGQARALANQRAAGALMWVVGSLALIAVLMASVWRALQDEQRRIDARDRYARRRAEQGT